MSRQKTELEMAALMIIFESSSTVTRSKSHKAYVRRKLLNDLERALVNSGFDLKLGFESVKAARRKEYAEYVARRDLAQTAQVTKS